LSQVRDGDARPFFQLAHAYYIQQRDAWGHRYGQLWTFWAAATLVACLVPWLVKRPAVRRRAFDGVLVAGRAVVDWFSQGSFSRLGAGSIFFLRGAARQITEITLSLVKPRSWPLPFEF
jgi:hypothetical protein